MKIYRLHRIQQLPVSPETCWDFFTKPHNLTRITPAYMNFRILSITGEENEIYAGQIIQYKVNIFPKIPVFWTTEITHVQPMELFVDEQRSGPYRFWHHQHRFRKIEGGIQMTDDVHYALPMGPAGRLLHRLLVKNSLNTIFDHRREVLTDIFGKMN